MIKNILAILGIFFCLAFAKVTIKKYELKAKTERAFKALDKVFDKDEFQKTIDEVYND